MEATLFAPNLWSDTLPYSIKSKPLGPAHIHWTSFTQGGEYHELGITGGGGHNKGCLLYHANRELCALLAVIAQVYNNA